MKKYMELYKELCEKYKVKKNAGYMETIKTMKKRGITKEELDELMEAWDAFMGVR